MDLPEFLGKGNDKLLLTQISGLETRDFCEDAVFLIARMERGSREKGWEKRGREWEHSWEREKVPSNTERKIR